MKNTTGFTETDTTIRLIPKRRKGILRLIFSRFGLALVLMILEILVIAAVFYRFTDYVHWFAFAQAVFSIVIIFYLFNCVMDASAKLTWLVLLMFFPVPGGLLLWYIRTDVGHRPVKKKIEDLIRETRASLSQDPGVIKDPALTGTGTDDLCRYLNRSGCFPIYRGTEAVYFPAGEKAFGVMLEKLKKAEKFIFLEFFIIDEGLMWGSILKILAEKARQGVDVRVMYDGMCEMSTLSADYPERMGSLGIQCKHFSPLRPFLSSRYNYRDHRKIMVIDGRTAFTGGINLADEYINEIERFGYWKDTALMLQGPAVQSFTLLFLQMWNVSEQEPSWEEIHAPVPPLPAKGFVMPYGDCPLDGDKVGEKVYIDILYRARSYVHIMTPYMILDNELEMALMFAAERGIDVRIILPGIPDKKAAWALAKSHYRHLLSSGVKLYEYTPGFVHAKVFVSDDEKAVVGTINMDYRSLYHHYECAAYLFRADCIPEIEADFQETLGKCREVSEETVRHESFYLKATGAVMKLFAPLM